MKKYFDHIKQKPTHQRRQHSMQAAGVATAVVFVIWIGTLGMRLAGPRGVVAKSATSTDNQTQLGAVVAGVVRATGIDQSTGAVDATNQTNVDKSVNTLEVSTTSVFSQ